MMDPNGPKKNNPKLVPKCHMTALNFSCYSQCRGVSTFIRTTINQNLSSSHLGTKLVSFCVEFSSIQTIVKLFSFLNVLISTGELSTVLFNSYGNSNSLSKEGTSI